MSDPNYDGKCGVAQPGLHTGGLQLRCLHDFDHAGCHSWEKYPNTIIGGANGPPAAVTLLIRKDLDKILAVARTGTTDQWGLPGGKVERNESLRQAAVRELKEETGLIADPRILSEVFVRQDYDGFQVTTFEVFEYTGTLKQGDTGPVKWVTREELAAGPFAEYNMRLLENVDKHRPIRVIPELSSNNDILGGELCLVHSRVSVRRVLNDLARSNEFRKLLKTETELTEDQADSFQRFIHQAGYFFAQLK